MGARVGAAPDWAPSGFSCLESNPSQLLFNWQLRRSALAFVHTQSRLSLKDSETLKTVLEPFVGVKIHCVQGIGGFLQEADSGLEFSEQNVDWELPWGITPMGGRERKQDWEEDGELWCMLTASSRLTRALKLEWPISHPVLGQDGLAFISPPSVIGCGCPGKDVILGEAALYGWGKPWRSCQLLVTSPSMKWELGSSSQCQSSYVGGIKTKWYAREGGVLVEWGAGYGQSHSNLTYGSAVLAKQNTFWGGFWMCPLV